MTTRVSFNVDWVEEEEHSKRGSQDRKGKQGRKRHYKELRKMASQRYSMLRRNNDYDAVCSDNSFRSPGSEYFRKLVVS